jgi:hypothetical protein
MTERTTVRLPDELLRQANRKAAEEGRTPYLSDWPSAVDILTYPVPSHI